MPRIRLLTSVAGTGPVVGRPGQVLEVDAATAKVWADGERAELVNERVEKIETMEARPVAEKAVTRARPR